MIKNIITDGTGEKTSAEVTNYHALKVSNTPYYAWTNETNFFVSTNYGIEMTINGSTSGGIVEEVHNGIDDVLWTGTGIIGTWDFQSSDQAYEGSYSIDGSDANNNDVAQIAKGSDLDLTSYTSLTGWIYVTDWGTGGTKEVNIYGWDVGVGQVGNTVDIGNYINTSNQNVWQKFTIPLADMGLVSSIIDAVRIQNVDIGPGVAPNWYMDTVQFEGYGALGGEPERYILAPPKGDIWKINNLNFFMVDIYDGVTGTEGVQKLEYDKLIGQTLESGINYQKISASTVVDVVSFSANIKNMTDLLTLPNMRIVNYSSDGTNTMLNLITTFAEPFFLVGNFDDRLIITINDDLRSMIHLRASAYCRRLLGKYENLENIIRHNTKEFEGY